MGAHAARYFTDAGAIVVGAADLSGAVYAEEGLDVAAMIAHKADGGVGSFEGGQHFDRDAVIGFDCDILVPGTQSQVFPIIDEKIRANTEETLERSERDGILPREAATQMAQERLAAAMQYRRFL